MIRLLLLCLSLVLVAGCVTVDDTYPTAEARESALDKHVKLGLGYLGEGARDSARFHFNKALEIDRDNAGAHNGLALLSQLEGDRELAEEYYRRAIREDRDFSQARYNYGVFLFQEERFDDACEQIEYAAEDRNYDKRHLATLALGICQHRQGDLEAAEATLRQALALAPGLPRALLELGEINFERGDYVAAKRYLEEFRKVAKPTPRSLWLGIRVEHHFGNKDQEASYALQLRNLHQYSDEYLEYKKWLEKNQ